MSTPRVARHGEHVKPHYAPAAGRPHGRVGESTEKARKDGEISGIVKRYAKVERASDNAIAIGGIKSRRADAIEYTGSPQELRGMVMLWSVAGLWFAWFGFYTGQDIYADSPASFVEALFWVFPPVLVSFSAFLILWTTRLELFRPGDEPTLFDRRHRKVYRIFRETQPGLAGLFKPWPLRAAEYEWDLIDVEHQARLTTTGSTVTRYHALVFLVKRSAADATIIDSFTIGNPMLLGEQTVPAVWEHIRRFMEEAGPHLPPGEQLAPNTPPQTLWQSLGAVGPIGPSYGRWWKDSPGFMSLIHVLFPFFVPMFLLWGFFNWLSYKTATRIEWPQEVVQAVGPAHPLNSASA